MHRGMLLMESDLKALTLHFFAFIILGLSFLTFFLSAFLLLLPPELDNLYLSLKTTAPRPMGELLAAHSSQLATEKMEGFYLTCNLTPVITERCYNISVEVNTTNGKGCPLPYVWCSTTLDCIPYGNNCSQSNQSNFTEVPEIIKMNKTLCEPLYDFVHAKGIDFDLLSNQTGLTINESDVDRLCQEIKEKKIGSAAEARLFIARTIVDREVDALKLTIQERLRSYSNSTIVFLLLSPVFLYLSALFLFFAYEKVTSFLKAISLFFFLSSLIYIFLLIALIFSVRDLIFSFFMPYLGSPLLLDLSVYLIPVFSAWANALLMKILFFFVLLALVSLSLLLSFILIERGK